MKPSVFLCVFILTIHFKNKQIKSTMRTKQLLFSIFTLAFLYSATAVAENEERNVSPFSAVSLNVSGTVYLEQGSPQRVRVEASESTLEELITEVKDGTLVIRLKNNYSFWRNFNHGKIEVYVTVPNIDALSVSGSGSIESGNIKSRTLDFKVSGSGDILVNNLDSKLVKANITGSGNIHLKGGSTDELSSTISGSGNLKAVNFQAANADLKVTGSGNCSLTARKSLKARVTGSGGISYKGSPQLDTNVTGSGRVKNL